MFKKLLLSLIVTVPVVAQAEWMYLGKDEEFTEYLEINRTVSTNDTLQYADTWLKLVVHTDLTKDGLAVGDYNLFKAQIKCKTLESALVAAYIYKKNKVIDSQVISYPEYTPIIPGSFGEDIAKIVCAALYGDTETY